MNKSLKPIHIIGASAGTGKTYQLASRFSSALSADNALCPTSIIATTFTNMAADELVHRIRKALLNSGQWNQAQGVFAAPIGTVNSICGRLAGTLAIDAGLPPSVIIIAEERQQKAFNAAVERVAGSYESDLWRVLYRLRLEDRWLEDVREIAALARQNNLAPDSLHLFAESSWRGLEALLPTPIDAQADFYGRLRCELVKALALLPAEGDNTRTTADQKRELQEILYSWESTDELPWHAALKISKAKPGKRSEFVVQALRELSREHIRLQEFHSDLKSLIYGAFDCAAECIRAYCDFKTQRGLLDFIDQEQLSLNLLQTPVIRDSLRGGFSKLFVDEFQDTSPIQLSVFLQLARLVNESIWVGDEKQSIFGFRGSDPYLMQTVVSRLVGESHGSREQLRTSFRSRPTLVQFLNSIFVPALSSLGMAPESIEIHSTARSEDGDMREAINIWWIAGTNLTAATQSLAQGVLDILLSPEEWLISAPHYESPRPIRGSDIAILCRSNDRRIQVADALSARGILVSTERSGLLETPECILILAAMRYLADRYDTLAMAELIRFTESGDDTGNWLHEWLEKGYKKVGAQYSVLQDLDEQRSQLIGLTPVECVQLLTTRPALTKTIIKWGNHRQRLLNLEALLHLARQYEETCAVDRAAASLAGLVTYMITSCSDAVQPANPDEAAVHVLTYHKAKGLEWPLVIMSDLDAPPSSTPFGVHVPRNREQFDATDPLASRTIRYWPWPYGQHKKDVELLDYVLKGPEAAEASDNREAESLRLLYVGMTRPRDYLVLACRNAGSGADWLYMAKDAHGDPIFQLNEGEIGIHSLLSNAQDVTAEFSIISSSETGGFLQLKLEPDRYTYEGLRASASAEDLPYSCAPSSLSLPAGQESSIKLEQAICLGPRLDLSDNADMRTLGDALHLFLATDDPSCDINLRVQNARDIANLYRTSSIEPEQFLRASTRLREKLDDLYPEAKWLTEWPVAGRYGTQRIQGAIDLLLELSEGYVIVDHKSFPGDTAACEKRALSHYPQLEAYAKLIVRATGKPVIATYIHMPMLGLLLHLRAIAEFSSDQSPHEEELSWLIL